MYSSYPATPENTNIRTIPHLRDMFDVHVGLSDHTMGTGVSVAAIALGASIIEKHFTINRADGGVDSAFSLEPDEMKALVTEVERAWLSLGHIFYGPTDVEKKSLVFRRSIYVAEDINEGEFFAGAKNIRIVRPGYGAPPYLYHKLLGRKARQFYKFGTLLTYDQIF